MNHRQAVKEIADCIISYGWKSQRDEVIWLLAKAYGEDKLDELLDDYSDCFEGDEK